MNFSTLFRSKKSADHALQDLIAGLKSGIGEALRSVIVFGSYAGGEFREGKSSVNVLVLASVLNKETLAALAAPVRSWTQSGHEPPVFLRVDEFAAMSQVLPIEFLDMVDHHRVVFGLDPFPELKIDTQRLGFQVEHDLDTLLLKLRRSIVVAGRDPKSLTQVVSHSIPSVWTLCRALLRLKGQCGPMSKSEAANRLSEAAGFDGALVRRLESFREAPGGDETEKLVTAYLELVEKLLHYARKQAVS